MIGKTVSHYRITSRLGSGGTGSATGSRSSRPTATRSRSVRTAGRLRGLVDPGRWQRPAAAHGVQTGSDPERLGPRWKAPGDPGRYDVPDRRPREAASRQTLPPLEGQSRRPVDLEWSPDGSMLSFCTTGLDGVDRLFGYSFATKSYRKLAERGRFAAWLADGRRLAFFERCAARPARHAQRCDAGSVAERAGLERRRRLRRALPGRPDAGVRRAHPRRRHLGPDAAVKRSGQLPNDHFFSAASYT